MGKQTFGCLNFFPEKLSLKDDNMVVGYVPVFCC